MDTAFPWMIENICLQYIYTTSNLAWQVLHLTTASQICSVNIEYPFVHSRCADTLNKQDKRQKTTMGPDLVLQVNNFSSWNTMIVKQLKWCYHPDSPITMKTDIIFVKVMLRYLKGTHCKLSMAYTAWRWGLWMTKKKALQTASSLGKY